MVTRLIQIALYTGFLAFLSSFNLLAQRTGDIVEIFGKDKVESTEEGNVVHKFTKAYVLRNAMVPGMLTGTQDIVFWQMAVNRFERPESGKPLSDRYKENSNPLRWELLEVDSTGYFKGDLGRAYVYTELDSPEERIALLDATGHTRVFINGMPHEGDHYDYGYTLVPFRLKNGLNQFVYTFGRFGRVSAAVIIPDKEIQFTHRDMTLPSVIRGEKEEKWGAIRVVNASDKSVKGLSIRCTLETGETTTYRTDGIMPLAVRKVKLRIPGTIQPLPADTLMATLVLVDENGNEIDRTTIKLKVTDAGRHHERTFISKIDGSVQYFSIAPSLSDADGQALVLSVHGASVEATNQARAYKQKDWAHIVAPTNRRPFGFNWEEWGRMDALEVLHEGRKLFKTDTSRTYLTGHSMGGHGSWFLGATYPDKWAAVAPCAGYPDIIGYRRDGSDTAIKNNPHFEMIYRGALAGRTVDLARNYLQSGVYVLHGGADGVVSVGQARRMRGVLGGFHNNFAYYEYPGGSHWYGDHSMDWPPLFDFLRQNTIPQTKDVREIEFITASPAVSASNYWIRINQQVVPYEHSTIKAVRQNDTIKLNSENVRNLTLLFSMLEFSSNPVIVIDEQLINAQNTEDFHLKRENGKWISISEPDYSEKHPGRYGGFKLAFQNNVVFVYATHGSEQENQWWMNKARFDAETFLYRGNSSVDVIADKDFSPENYADRNVIIYGNADNNSAWNFLLADCPVQVGNDWIKFGSEVLAGNDLGAYFIFPRPDSDIAAVGVVAATGIKGMKAAFANDYFSGITGFPDLMIFHTDWIKDGLSGVKVSGFFGSQWDVESGDFQVTED